LPKVVPYLVLPLSMAMLLFRFGQAAVAIGTGKMDRLVASHEVEKELDQIQADQHEITLAKAKQTAGDQG
ncbi:MAG: hypothetical protein HOH32_07850, partial [Rhodobacteraceae bacterium]|nr:hypothetical protein [Paracoccaceae bacterium]